MITTRFMMLLVLLVCIGTGWGGCASGTVPVRGPDGAVVKTIDPQQLQRGLMSFADRYLAAVADVYDRAQASVTTPQARMMAQRLKLLAGIEAMANAVEPNPVSGLMGMAVMAELARQIAEEGWMKETFGSEMAAQIVATQKSLETDIWHIAEIYLSTQQIDELHRLAERWHERHPNQRYLAGTRMADFPEFNRNDGGAAASQVASHILGLVTLDPFGGLDPAVREIAESRVLAERFFFYLRHAPTMLAWQTDALFNRMLVEPQVAGVLADMATVAASTTRFSEATTHFSEASGKVADSVEKFRVQLPDQQAKLITELNDLVAKQREGALDQVSTQLTAQLDASIKQLTAAITAQQNELTRNVQGLTDHSIDRVYQRAKVLVLITIGSILAAFVVYRCVGMCLWKRRAKS